MAALSPGLSRSRREGEAIGWVTLGVALIAGLYARLAHLEDLGLWMDEGWTLFFATKAGLIDLLQENHPPLYYLALKLPMIFLEGDGALRATGTLASLGSMAIAYRLVRATGGSVTAACLAAAAVAVASADVLAARQLRMYPWMVLLFALALAAAWRWRNSQRPRDALLMLLPCVALCYVHGIGVFYAGSACLFALLVARDARARWRVVALGIVVLLLFAPWVWMSTVQRLEMMDPETGLIWRRPVSIFAMLISPLRLFVDSAPLGSLWPADGSACGDAAVPGLCEALRLGTWRLRGYVALLAFVLALAAFFFAVLRAARARGWRHGRAPVLALLVASSLPPLLLAVVEWTVSPWFDVRYLVPLVVPLGVVFGLLSDSAHDGLTRAAAVLLLAVVTASTLAFPRAGTFQQIREAVDALSAVHRPGEVVFVNGEGQGSDLLVSRYLDRHDKSVPLVPFRQYVYDNYHSSCPPTPGNCLDRLDQQVPASGPDRAWLIRMPNRLDDPRRFRHGGALQQWLAQHYEVVGERKFNAVDLVEMRRR